MNPKTILASLQPHESGRIVGLDSEGSQVLIRAGLARITAAGLQLTAAGMQARFEHDLAASGGKVYGVGGRAILGA